MLKKIKPHSTLNYAMNIIDGMFFSFGLIFISFNTILPVFLGKLGGSNLVISFLPFILSIGVSLPQLFIASYSESLERKKPLITIFAIGQRLPWLIMTVACFTMGTDYPGMLIIITLSMVCIYSLSCGLLTPPWFQMVSRIIPVNLRGRVTSIKMAVAQFLGIIGAVVATNIISKIAYPYNYSLLFLICFILMAVSFVFYGLTAEVADYKKVARKDTFSFLKGIPGILKEDKNFRHFVISRGLSDLSTSVTAFYSIYAIRHFSLSEGYAGIFTTISGIAFVISYFIFGIISDRRGHKLNIVIGLLASILVSMIAISTENIYVYLSIFALTAVAQGAKDISLSNLTIEFCTAEKVPTYIALSSVITVPVSLIMLGMGTIADVFGYKYLFALALAASVIAVLIMLKVREPRKKHNRIR